MAGDGEWWRTYGTATLAFLSGVGYVTGVATMAVFSGQLGVSVQDLGLSARDFVALAAVYAIFVVLALLVGLLAVVVVGDIPRLVKAEYTSSWLVAVTVFLVASFGLVLGLGMSEPEGGPNNPRWYWFYVFLLSAALAIWAVEIRRQLPRKPDRMTLDTVRLVELMDRSDRKAGFDPISQEARDRVASWRTAKSDLDRWWRLGRLRLVPPTPWARVVSAVSLLLIVLLPAIVGWEHANRWADRLRDGSIHPAPLAFNLVLQPSTGHTTDGGSCVIRVSPDVLIVDGSAVVGDVPMFRATDCQVGSPDE